MQTLIHDNHLEAEDVLNTTEELDEVNFAVLPGLDYEVNIFGRLAIKEKGEREILCRVAVGESSPRDLLDLGSYTTTRSRSFPSV